MRTGTLSFRVTEDFAPMTKSMASALSMSASDYVREAVREKNERALKDRMVFLSKALSVIHLAESLAMDGSTEDGVD